VRVRGVRGAVRVSKNSAEEIMVATQELLVKMIHDNEIALEDIAGAFFTTTYDLNAIFPAQAAREIGMQFVPMMCSSEIVVPDSLTRVIRVMLLINTEKKQEEVKHIYLGETKILRPDLGQNHLSP
jgi:chorismate mutase